METLTKMKTAENSKKMPWWLRVKLRIVISVGGFWPVYRVTYKDGERTRPLTYAEAKGCAEVFGGKVWIDYQTAYFLHTGENYKL